jgi:putative hydrolase of the HAD superfamily
MDATGIRCVAFDVDDTLYLERDFARGGFEAVDAWLAAELGITGFAAVAWDLLEKGLHPSIFLDALTEIGVEITPDRLTRFLRIYREHEPDIALLPDAIACLERLEGHVALWAITSGLPALQEAKVRALGLEIWISNVIFSGDLGKGLDKPHPRAFEIVARQSNWEGDQCAYVGDNPKKDFSGPKSLGWRTVRVRRPGGLFERTPSTPDVDIEITDLSELEAALQI